MRLPLLFLVVVGVTLVLCQTEDEESDGFRPLLRRRGFRRPGAYRRIRPIRPPVEEDDEPEFGGEDVNEPDVDDEELDAVEIPRRRVVVRKFRPRQRPRPVIEPVKSSALPARPQIPSQALPDPINIVEDEVRPEEPIPPPPQPQIIIEPTPYRETNRIRAKVPIPPPPEPQVIIEPTPYRETNRIRAEGPIPPPPEPQVIIEPTRYRETNRIRADASRPRPVPVREQSSVFSTGRRPSLSEELPQARRQESPRPSVGVRPKHKTDPIEIVDNYSHQNEDGSFTFGYVSADGSFKEETRGVDCIVRGKFGYVDPDGVKREFSYTSGLPCDEEEFDEFGNPLDPDEDDLGLGFQTGRGPITSYRSRPRPVIEPVASQDEDEEEVLPAVRPAVRPAVLPAVRPVFDNAQPRPVRIQPAKVRAPQRIVQAPAVLHRQPARPAPAPARAPQRIVQAPAVLHRRPAPAPAAAPRPAPAPTPTRVVQPVQQRPSSFNFDTEFNRFSLPRGQSAEGAVYSTQLIFDPVTGQYNTVVVQQIPETGTNVGFRSQLQARGATTTPKPAVGLLRKPKPAPQPATALPATDAGNKQPAPVRAPKTQVLPQRVATTQVLPQQAPTTQVFPQRAPSRQVFPQRAPSRQVFPQRAPATQVFPQGAQVFPQRAPAAQVFPQRAPGTQFFTQGAPTRQVFPQRPEVIQRFQRPAATSPVGFQPGQPSTASGHINKFISDFNLGIAF